jgi:hypothetical protein
MRGSCPAAAWHLPARQQSLTLATNAIGRKLDLSQRGNGSRLSAAPPEQGPVRAKDISGVAGAMCGSDARKRWPEVFNKLFSAPKYFPSLAHRQRSRSYRRYLPDRYRSVLGEAASLTPRHGGQPI